MVPKGDAEQLEARSGAQAVERAMAILNCFASGEGDLGISEIANRTGLRVSTAHRIVRAMCSHRFMEQDERTERYRLGRALVLLGQRASAHQGLAEAEKELDRLSSATGESASLAIRQGGEVLVLLVSVSHQRLRFDHDPGSSIDAHASAMGKVLLAFGSEPVESVVAALPRLTKHTEHTITSRARLLTALHEVRSRGVATNVEERFLGVNGLAAPVLDRFGVAQAAVGVQGPSSRLTSQRIELITDEVRESATAIARVLPVGRL